MELVAKTIKTPVGTYTAPLNPHFVEDLAKCNTHEDLYTLVESASGHICPDALNEVDVRGIYADYCEWRIALKKTF